MKIICLFAQRKCQYDGEYAPELIAAIDEYGDDENPVYMWDKLNELRLDADIEFYKKLEIVVPDDEFDQAFYPKSYRLTGTVQVSKEE